jgi:methylthioribose-1-phosphate isomerase
LQSGSARRRVGDTLGAVDAVAWVDDRIQLIDQTLLPHEVKLLEISSVSELVDAIQRLAVRGAPALGVAGALGVVVAIDEAEREGWDTNRRNECIAALRAARPTAVNLEWAVDQVAPFAPSGRGAALERALAIMDADRRGSRELGCRGADWLVAHLGSRPLRLLTHCNTGALATTGRGTALGVVRELADRGLVDHVVVDETRPLLQGSRLTAWELVQAGIDHVVIADGAAPGVVLGGRVDAVVVGADRIAGNGDTANKVGTVGLALACADAGIPFVVAAPESTIDAAMPDGAHIQIEARDEDEVLSFAGKRVAPIESRAMNPAFDVTPARLVTAIVTDARVIDVAGGDHASR